MALVFIGLGSNLGDGRANLRRAWALVAALEGVTPRGLSCPYLTEPVGMDSAQWFTNAVGALETGVPPRALLASLLAIERRMGRDRAAGLDRIVDLDLLLYGDLLLEEEGLSIPHPEMHRRLFVLAPLEELAPDHVHPRIGRTVARLRRDCAGQAVRKTSWCSRQGASDVREACRPSGEAPSDFRGGQAPSETEKTKSL